MVNDDDDDDDDDADAATADDDASTLCIRSDRSMHAPQSIMSCHPRLPQTRQWSHSVATAKPWLRGPAVA